jgi:16S rRNA (guanine527-N7)-methyltransferase
VTSVDASSGGVEGAGVAGTDTGTAAEALALTQDWVRAAAQVYFGERLPLAERYASTLATDGVIRGLIGPREAPRIWDRHLLNCAAVAELVPPGGDGPGGGVRVIDAGSGAGLPGLVLALVRPDLDVTLVEPKLRATTFLSEVVTALGLEGRVTVVRARAEECHGRLPAAEVVVVRALAPLDRLTDWCLPLAKVGGRVLALKGESAAEEVAVHAVAIRRRGGGRPAVRRCGADHLTQPTTVVEIRRERAA